MTKFSAITRLSRAAALALTLGVVGLASTTYAADEYGFSGQEGMDAALSARYANQADTPLAQATELAKARESRVSSQSPVATGQAGPMDLDGQGGAQDQYDRQIYTPGRGTDW